MPALNLRRLVLPAALVPIALFDISCGNDSGAPTPTPSDVVVTPGADTLFSINASRAFTAQVLDENGHPVDAAVVTWSSSAPGVLSVDPGTGVATAHANGAAQVTATSGALHGSANAFVVQLVASVTVTPGNASLTAVGDTVRFTAVPKDSLGTPVANAQVLWSVNDNTVATIDTLGLAKAKGPGTVLVSAQAQTRAGYAALGVTQAAASVVITAAPDSALAGQYFTGAVQVEIRDSNGVRVHNASLPVTIGLVGGDGPSGMIGVKTLTTVDGAASFQHLGATRAGSLQLSATAPGVAAGTGPVTIAPAAPKKLTIESFKDTLAAGDTLQALIAIRDTYGNQTTVDGVPVGAKMVRDVGGGLFSTDGLTFSLGGSSVGGIVDHFDAQAYEAASGWSLIATSPGLDSAVAGPIAIVPGPPTHTEMFFDGIHFSSPYIGVGASRSAGLSAYIADLFGNVNPAAPSTPLTIELVSWDYGTPGDPALTQLLNGTVSGSTTAGALALPDLALRRPGMTHLRAVGGGLTPFTFDVEGRIYDKHGVAAGGRHACLLGEGGAYCWGDNSSGQLTGGGARDSVARPVQGAPALVSLVAGDSHTCGLTAAGVAWCWGKNDAGQLGRNTATASEPVPAAVVTGVAFTSLSAGGDHTCGIALADSTAWCWGRNGDGEIGDSTVVARSVPTLVHGGHKFLQISAGATHTCGVAVGSTGTAYCWGDNSSGQGGTGSITPDSLLVPTAVVMDSMVTVAAGTDFTCAEVRMSSGDLNAWCWGQGIDGRLGYASQVYSKNPTPVAIPTVGAVTQGTIVVGLNDACVFSNGFNMYYCWGDNGDHQINQNGGTQYPVYAPFGAGLAPGGIGVGTGFICTVGQASGFLYIYGDTHCTGTNDMGQRGVGNTSAFTPLDTRAVQ